jgi:class 3 adenylate cyclase
VLVSESALQSAGRPPDAAQPVGRFTLRGRQQPTEIFRLL